MSDFNRYSGTHLLSHAVSSIVPSAACVLTVVFGMGTGVSHKRIGTGNFRTNERRFQHRSRKEVFQPHLPVRLPCYDLAPVTSFTLGRSFRLRTSGTPGSHGLTGGVYKARERIHRAVADARLLANPASRSRVADFDPN